MRLQPATTVVMGARSPCCRLSGRSGAAMGPRGSASPDLLRKRCRRALSVRSPSTTATLCSIKLTSTEVLEGGVSVRKGLMRSRDTGGRGRPPERKNLTERVASQFWLCGKVRQLTEQPRRVCGHRDHGDKRDKHHLDGRQAGLRSKCRHSRHRPCATLRPAPRPSSKSRLCRR